MSHPTFGFRIQAKSLALGDEEEKGNQARAASQRMVVWPGGKPKKTNKQGSYGSAGKIQSKPL
jgi:hypothetical protein